MGRDRAVVDDPPAARRLPLHQAERALRAKKGAVEVDVDHRLPLRVASVRRAARRARSGPALLNSRSSRPKPCSIVRNIALHRLRIADVAGRGDGAAADWPISRAASSSFSLRRPASATVQPARASASAEALPIPAPAPVTRANLSPPCVPPFTKPVRREDPAPCATRAAPSTTAAAEQGRRAGVLAEGKQTPRPARAQRRAG